MALNETLEQPLNGDTVINGDVLAPNTVSRLSNFYTATTEKNYLELSFGPNPKLADFDSLVFN